MNISDIDDDIYYIEDTNDGLLAHTKSNSYLLTASFMDIKSELSGNFYYANPNTIINNDKVIEYNYIDCNLILDNGVKIDRIVKKYDIC